MRSSQAKCTPPPRKKLRTCMSVSQGTITHCVRVQLLDSFGRSIRLSRLLVVPIFAVEFVEPRKRNRESQRAETVYPRPSFRAPAFAMSFPRLDELKRKIRNCSYDIWSGARKNSFRAPVAGNLTHWPFICFVFQRTLRHRLSNFTGERTYHVWFVLAQSLGILYTQGVANKKLSL